MKSCPAHADKTIEITAIKKRRTDGILVTPSSWFAEIPNKKGESSDQKTIPSTNISSSVGAPKATGKEWALDHARNSES
jgi:hypothetical protein